MKRTGTRQRPLVTEKRNVVVDWASETQKQVFEYGPYPLCASGGFGASKTWAMILKLLWLSDTFPGNRGVIARRVWDELRKTTLATLWKILPQSAYNQGGRRADNEKILRLNNGSEILFMHLDNPEVETIIRGLEINWFFIDQAEEVEEALFDLLMARLGRWDAATVPVSVLDTYYAQGKEWPWVNRAGMPIPPTYALLTANPDSEIHWLYRRFHPDSPEHYEKKIITDPAEPTKLSSYHDLGYRMFHMSSLDNKHLPKQNIANLLNQDKSFVDRFVLGKWGVQEGQIHHVMPESIIPGDPVFVAHLLRTCRLYRVLDHGDSAPTCCLWFAVDAGGNVFCYREYYVPNELISTHRSNIAALSVGERYAEDLADPNIFVKTQQKYGGRWSVADEYSDVTNLPRDTALYWLPADNNEMGTRNRINEYLRIDPDRVHPYKHIKGSPRLFFITRTDEYPNGVFHALQETKAQRREKIGTELGKPVFSDERSKKIKDHSYDCVRYMIAGRPSPNKTPVKSDYSMTFSGRRQAAIRFHRAQKAGRVVVGGR